MAEFKPNQGGLDVANDLTELTPHINEMRTKLSQTADHERSLTQALSDELRRMDQETLRNVSARSTKRGVQASFSSSRRWPRASARFSPRENSKPPFNSSRGPSSVITMS